jgi:DNA-binding transcriptional LysR family regulator
MVAKDIEAGRLMRLLPGYTPPIRPVSLLYLRDRRMSTKLRSFVEFIVERLGRE